MDIKLYNTLSRKKELFKPIEANTVKMYTCGPTVYNSAHIGNMRSYILADLLKRILTWGKYEVFSVENITDVGHLTDDENDGEDKVEEAARNSGKNAREISHEYTAKFIDDCNKLNITDPSVWAHASAHVGEQIAMIEELEGRGYTYRISDGIYFDTSKFGNYGELANLNIDGLKEGARVQKNPEKKHVTDFALWKFSPIAQKRQMEWESPWGIGFPGWHIECSAMSRKYLGFPFDIHTGGIDHIPIHHTNEIAQNEALFGNKTVNYWLHNEFITVDGQKMSKSLGNTFTLDDLIERGYSPLDYRYFLLGTHYRQMANFTFEALEAAHQARSRIIRILRESEKLGEVNNQYIDEFISVLFDDINTPQALAALWNMLGSTISTEDKLATALEMDKILGLGLDASIKKIEFPDKIASLIKQREFARTNQDFAQSDKLRQEIEQNGYIVRDTPDGQQIEAK